MPRIIVHDHLDEDVSRIETALGRHFTAVADILNLLSREKHFTEQVLVFRMRDPVNQCVVSALLHAGINMNGVPLHVSGRCIFFSVTRFGMRLGFFRHFDLRPPAAD